MLPYFFFINNRLLDSRDLSLGLNSFSKVVLGQKLGIQIYRQVIITIIKEFILEKLNFSTLLLDEEDNSLKELVALQSNYSSKVEEENTLGLANSLAVRFSKPLIIRESRSSTSLNTKKQRR